MIIRFHVNVHWLDKRHILPETNIFSLKLDGWKTRFLLEQKGLFSVAFAVSFRECTWSLKVITKHLPKQRHIADVFF